MTCHSCGRMAKHRASECKGLNWGKPGFRRSSTNAVNATDVRTPGTELIAIGYEDPGN